MPEDKRPLQAYLRVERNAEQRLNSMLRQAATDIERDIRQLVGRGNIGSVVRLDQLRLVQKDILERHAELMQQIGRTVESERLTAAADAIRVTRLYDGEIFRAAGLSDEFIDAYQASAVLTSKQAVEGAMQRLLGKSYVPLAESVYRAEQWSAGIVDRFVDSALARGLTWVEFAKGVKDMIRPDVPGGVSYAAKRLARTEINNAAHAQSKEQYDKNPMVESVKWHLSGSHPTPDECNEYAESQHFKGGGQGDYMPNDVPSKPHPQCLCFITPNTPTPAEFIDKLFAGDYDDGDYGDGIMLDAKEELQRTGVPVRSASSTPERGSYTKDWDIDSQPTIARAAAAEAERERLYALRSSLDRDDVAAVKHYVGSGYNRINLSLRNPGTSRLDSSMAEDIAGIDRVLAAGSLTQDTTLFRAITTFEGGWDPSTMRVGELFSDAAYLSTSTSRAAIQDVIKQTGGDHQAWTFVIRAPSGTRAAAGSVYESELVLGRGSVQRIAEIDLPNRIIYTEIAP